MTIIGIVSKDRIGENTDRDYVMRFIWLFQWKAEMQNPRIWWLFELPIGKIDSSKQL